ncbi:hypothetical protein [Williamwhitmania taraxaci]|uniref:Uncharacterized protein n=1 Tax=Williamwhitmania taraxaci TaxID=1640674 RepID=A0A1G6GTN4_9BACT|nr:hypothetical protein [Williamwhitmania taraxaci]SDB85390.1 hypothetical protein SAMN05216323_100416 [Williamwhitmania taraxaci]
MKKYLFAITFLFIAPLAYANMASPYIEGSQFCSPLTSRNIRILKETIDVSINSNFSAAVFDVQYQIQAKIEGNKYRYFLKQRIVAPILRYGLIVKR